MRKQTSFLTEWDSYFVTTHCFFTAEGDCNDGFCISDSVTASGDTLVAVRPTVSSISPNKALIGTSNNVTIHGTGFTSGLTLGITGGSISNVSVQSSTTITANYLIDDNALEAIIALRLRWVDKPARTT